MPKDEFEWIKQNTPSRYTQPGIIEGIGDDAAVYSAKEGFHEILCVDTMVEGIHFKKETMSPADIGHKALAVNISDVAAMGGLPVFYMVSIAVPPSWTDDELEDLYHGMTALGENYEMDMIGGDTISSPHDFMVSVTVYGRVEKGRHLVRRNARPGDIVFLTNPTGRSGAGLELLLEHGRHKEYTWPEVTLITYHQRPVPRVAEGRIIAETTTAASLNDISDGLASEANEIAEASDVEIELFKQDIPVAEELQRFSEKQFWNWILYGGEDFELIGTVPEKDWPVLQKRMHHEGKPLISIGRVKQGSALVMLTDGRQQTVLPKQGYNHFRT
ncbi:thiamine-phosphate kinase [Salibacterium aidingense]|uniref:thiamine-phosphate kinase n=1 Tax=Salibacterium aidingense TaxID=384933 RepID=UPI003BBF1E95